MLGTRALARLVIPILVATTMPTLVAGESVGGTPPSNSIREWKTIPTAAPPGPTVVAGDSVGTTPPSTSIHEWKTNPSAAPTTQTGVAGGSVGTPIPAKSIREWKTNTIATPCLDPAANPTANAAATPTASPVGKPAITATAPKSPVRISITSTLRQGNLVVLLDDVPIFNEKFQKPLLLISQTTTWDPLQVTAGKHRLSAKVHGAKKTYVSRLYDLELSRTRGGKLHFVIRGDQLTVELGS